MKEKLNARVIVSPLNRVISLAGLLGGVYVGKKVHDTLAVNGIGGAKNVAASIAAGYATAAIAAGVAEAVSPRRTELVMEEEQ